MTALRDGRAERHAGPALLRPVGPEPEVARAPSLAMRVTSLILRFVRACARLRRSRRQGLHNWMSMDPRVLRDIGVTRTDVQAVLYGGVPVARLGVRRAGSSGAEVAVTPGRRAPKLRVVGPDDLDAAA